MVRFLKTEFESHSLRVRIMDDVIIHDHDFENYQKITKLWKVVKEESYKEKEKWIHIYTHLKNPYCM